MDDQSKQDDVGSDALDVARLNEDKAREAENQRNQAKNHGLVYTPEQLAHWKEQVRRDLSRMPAQLANAMVEIVNEKVASGEWAAQPVPGPGDAIGETAMNLDKVLSPVDQIEQGHIDRATGAIAQGAERRSMLTTAVGGNDPEWDAAGHCWRVIYGMSGHNPMYRNLIAEEVQALGLDPDGPAHGGKAAPEVVCAGQDQGKKEEKAVTGPAQTKPIPQGAVLTDLTREPRDC